MKTVILAVGKMRGSDAELCDVYLKRLGKNTAIREIATATQKAEGEVLLKALAAKAFVVLCDEQGKDLSSREMADKLSGWTERGELVFVIGGADGVTDAVKSRADFTLSFGRKTWPHRLARVMLLEQIYRARQIAAGHPYHRD
jgi:23S rRNA (pseudouridine1915-N3)-methyltransferase